MSLVQNQIKVSEKDANKINLEGHLFDILIFSVIVVFPMLISFLLFTFS